MLGYAVWFLPKTCSCCLTTIIFYLYTNRKLHSTLTACSMVAPLQHTPWWPLSSMLHGYPSPAYSMVAPLQHAPWWPLSSILHGAPSPACSMVAPLQHTPWCPLSSMLHGGPSPAYSMVAPLKSNKKFSKAGLYCWTIAHCSRVCWIITL